jgi:hypothetical protein
MKHFFQMGYLLVFALVIACARMSAPTGGPKDEDPPIPLKSSPVNYSTQFKGDKIIIQFDEFVALKNIRQELMVSPPLPEKPIVKQRGKNLIIKINNKLKDSTTYNFNFYNAIGDLNENNPLPNFQFEFSTGDVFDSLYMGGILRDGFNYKAEASLYVMLYEQFCDSTPRTTLPDILAKTDESGQFVVTNLKNKPYHIFALKDLNNNLKFDLPNESIAFTDSLFQPGFKERTTIDTVQIIQSISADRKDTVIVDSVIFRKEMVTTIDNINLFLFAEDYTNQYFKEIYRPERLQLILSFNRMLDSSYSIVPLSNKPWAGKWMVEEKTQRPDSLIYWISDSTLFNQDSLKLKITYTVKDSNLIDYIKTDTLVAFFETKIIVPKTPKEEKPKGGLFNMNLFGNKDKLQKVDSGPKPSELTFKTNAKTPFELNLPVELVARFPIQTVDQTRIKLVNIVDDTVKKPLKFTLKQDTLLLRKYLLDFKKGEDEKYELFVPAGVFTDIYGNINDTLKYIFTTRTLDYYGNITLHMKGVKGPSYIQFLDEKEVTVEQRKIWSDTTLVYNYITPKKYIFKLFFDTNGNGKWDTGNLRTRTQPESVYYFPKTIEAKSNWDMDDDWILLPVTPSHLIKTKKGAKGKTKETKTNTDVPGNIVPQGETNQEE